MRVNNVSLRLGKGTSRIVVFEMPTKTIESALTLHKQGGGWFLRYKGASIMEKGHPVRFNTLTDAGISITNHLSTWLSKQG
jgi:hypothetical protein